MQTHECEHEGGYDISNMTFCPAILRLFEEHIPLREKLHELNEMVLDVQNTPFIENWNEPIKQIYDKLTVFVKELELHASKEDDALFPLMAKHLGYDNKPLMVMEFEHGLAQDNLTVFMNGAEQLDDPIDKNEATSLLTSLHVAYITLINHFLKEERILFPMAEELLSDEEKQELLKKMQQI
ncbi:hemerythrin domain-containing protein [Anaerobacillus sp. MEB173]|uniref:hemerythrin domain-containing protein n=1 Tax=Anaerobacillus sp. MEB173 TaxID=3383345 RepID=UPI003F926BB7